MDKQVTITKVRLTALRYFKECNDDNLYEDFRTEYSVQECGDAFDWLIKSKYLSDCDKHKFKLNDKGLSILEQVEAEINNRKDKNIKIENKRWWDRFLQNGQYILNTIFGAGLLFFAYLTYNQSDKNKSIIELQDLRLKDSLQFSTTLRDLENQLIQQNKTLQNIQEYISKDSLDNSFKVGQKIK